MASASGESKKVSNAMLQASKALSAAAGSLASAAEALSLLCEEQDEEDNATVKSGGSASIDDQKSLASPKTTSVVNYDSGDSDDDFMALAREQVRVATAAMPSLGDLTPPGKWSNSRTCDLSPYISQADTQSRNSVESDKPVFSVTLADIQARFGDRSRIGGSSSMFSPPMSTAGRSDVPTPMRQAQGWQSWSSLARGTAPTDSSPSLFETA